MKILLGKHIKEADIQTINNEPIDSINLMERASETMAQWLCNNVPQESQLCFFMGKGGNGGDGLAMLRMLHNAGYEAVGYMLFDKKQFSEDCLFNFNRMPESAQVGLVTISDDGVVMCSGEPLEIAETATIVDAILGSGLKGEPSPEVAAAIDFINNLPNRVISIDIPSGMATEWNSADCKAIKADTTLTIEFPKLSFMLPEAGDNVGKIEVMSIDLDSDYIEATDDKCFYVDDNEVRERLMDRRKFAHKGEFGHLLLVCGSEGMAGAAVLSTGAALRSGVGLATVHLPVSERFAIYATSPSAMVSGDSESCFSTMPKDMDRYSAVAVGCGMGRSEKSSIALRELLLEATSRNISMIIDADALNIISHDKSLLELIPSGSILTPHIGELRRLVGEWDSDKMMIELACRLAQSIDSYVVIKGAHTITCTPNADLYFNSTGSSGMAKAGSGDVLTGYIGGLLARGYDSLSAALIGVYFHGRAGEKAAEYYGAEGMNSGDIADMIAEASAEFE